MNLTKMHKPSTPVKFLGFLWHGACQESSSRVKDKLLHLGPPTNYKDVQFLVGFSGFWKQHIPNVGVLPQLIF